MSPEKDDATSEQPSFAFATTIPYARLWPLLRRQAGSKAAKQGRFLYACAMQAALAFRADIQGLRALAIALVVATHAEIPGFTGGFVGVDMFFVLSGFLITRLLVKERFATGTVHYGRFLMRRLQRLLPAMYVMLVSVTVFAAAALSDYEAILQTGSLLFALSWLSNAYFAFAEFDYFAALQAKDFFLHTWSLGVEEQFYVIWPWLITAAFAGTRRYSRFALALLLVSCTGLALCLYWSVQHSLWAFYMMPARSWQFAAGAAVFVVTARSRPGPAAATAASVVGALLVALCTVFLHRGLSYPSAYALLPTAATALLLFAGSSVPTVGTTRLLSSGLLVWLGNRSYSLYLWHWPVLLIGRSYGLANSSLDCAGLLGVSMMLAVLSYRYVELPFWKGRFSAAPPRLVALCAVLAVVSAIAQAESWVSNRQAHIQRVAGQNARNDATALATGLRCDSWYHNADVMPCTSGNPRAARTVALIGDSIGAQWAALLPEIYRTPEWRVVVLTKSACAMADIDYFYAPVGGDYEVCTTWRGRSIEYLTELKPDILFVGSSSRIGFDETQWVTGARRVYARLASAAASVVVIPGTPDLGFDGPSCLEQPYRYTARLRDSERLCEVPLSDEVTATVANYLASAAQHYANVHVLDLTDLVCPGRRCAARNESGIAVFRDEQHLSATFVKSLAPQVLKRLTAMGAAN